MRLAEVVCAWGRRATEPRKCSVFKGRMARALESDCRGSRPSPAAYSPVTLGTSSPLPPSLSLVTREVGLVELALQCRGED